MSRLLITTIVALTLALSAVSTPAQQNGYDLFQKALVKERAVGDVEEAIRIYQQIVREFGGNHALAAKALLRLGLLYNRLGRTAEAQRAFNTIVTQYADQTEIARQARAKLVTTARTSNAVAERKLPVTMGLRRVWDGNNVDISGSPSPDGTYFSFVDWETGDLAVRELDTDKSRRVTNKGPWSKSQEFAMDSVISPDGKQIVYTWNNKEWSFDLRLIGVDGSNPRVLYHNDQLTYIQPFEWSSDAKQILVYVYQRNQIGQIGLISVADGTLRVIKTMDWWRSPAGMSLSPDGQYIVFDSRQKQGAFERDLFIVATRDDRESLLIQHPANDEIVGWTPDGRRVLFISDRTGVNSMWSVRIGAGKPLQSPELIKPDIGRGAAMGFTRNGTLYFGFITSMVDVYMATIDATTGKVSQAPKAVTERYVGSNSGPAFSPDGRWLAYISNRGVSLNGRVRVVAIRSLETNTEREINPMLSSFFRPQWSPDSNSLMVSGVDTKGVSGIYRIDAHTGDVTPMVQVGESLTDGRIVRWASWSPDGKSIYYLLRSQATKNDRVFVRNLDTGQEREIFRTDAGITIVNNLAVSADGREIAFFVLNPGPVIKIIKSTGEPTREISLDPKEAPLGTLGIGPIAWTPDGRHLVYATANTQNAKTELWRVPVEGGQPQKVGISMESLAGLSMHPDGKRIAFSAGQLKSEVWAFEHLLPPEPKIMAKRRQLAHRKR
jgi:Tol biopolymer transport system component